VVVTQVLEGGNPVTPGHWNFNGIWKEVRQRKERGPKDKKKTNKRKEGPGNKNLIKVGRSKVLGLTFELAGVLGGT